MTHRLRPRKAPGRRTSSARRPAGYLKPKGVIGIFAVGLSAAATMVVVLRRRQSRQPEDTLARFPAHRKLRGELIRFAGTLNAQRDTRAEWRANGESVLDSDALQLANESVVAKAFDLRDAAEALEPLLEQERERAREIGPTTFARLAKLSEYAEIGTRLVPSAEEAAQCRR